MQEIGFNLDETLNMNWWKVNIYNPSFVSFRKLAGLLPTSLGLLSQRQRCPELPSRSSHRDLNSDIISLSPFGSSGKARWQPCLGIWQTEFSLPRTFKRVLVGLPLSWSCRKWPRSTSNRHTIGCREWVTAERQSHRKAFDSIILWSRESCACPQGPAHKASLHVSSISLF